MSDLKDALKQLDVNNDDHWTKGGLPLVDVVSGYHGEPVTRAEIAEVWPEFSRDVLRAEIETPPSAAVASSAPTDEEIAASAAIETTGPVTAEGGTEADAIDLIEQALAASQTDRFRHNHDLHAFLRGFYVQQVNIRAAQKRLDERNERRNKG